MKIFRTIIAVVLLFDVVDTVAWLASIMGEGLTLDPLALVIVFARAAVGGLEAVAAWHLLRGRRSAAFLTRLAVIGAAVLTTLILGFGLAPSDLPPGERSLVVAITWIVAVVAVLAVWRV